MEGISRKNIDNICDILKQTSLIHTNGEKNPSQLAKILEDYDIIPKLYAYTYFKKVFVELTSLKGDNKSIDMDELEQLVDTNEKLQLDFIKSRTEANKLLMFLKTGFERESQFCDFDDSKFHDKTKIGSCQNEDHYENIDEPIISLTEKEQKEFNEITETNSRYEAMIKFEKNYNPDNQELTAVYYPNEESHKYRDEPEWICKTCSDGLDGGDCEVSVSCDMEDDL